MSRKKKTRDEPAAVEPASPPAPEMKVTTIAGTLGMARDERSHIEVRHDPVEPAPPAPSEDEPSDVEDPAEPAAESVEAEDDYDGEIPTN